MLVRPHVVLGRSHHLPGGNGGEPVANPAQHCRIALDPLTPWLAQSLNV
jgi:hypothetical protein